MYALRHTSFSLRWYIGWTKDWFVFIVCLNWLISFKLTLSSSLQQFSATQLPERGLIFLSGSFIEHELIFTGTVDRGYPNGHIPLIFKGV